MFKQIKLNFKRLVLGERAMALLFVVVQLLSVMTIYFSYGVINHFDTKIDAVEGITTEYSFEVKNEELGLVKASELYNLFEDIIPVLENKTRAMFAMGRTDDKKSVIVSFGYKNGSVTLSPLLKDVVGKDMHSGRLFEDDELNRGDCVAIVGKELLDEGETIVIGDKEYKIVGVTNMDAYSDMSFVPYKAMPDTYNRIRYFSIHLTKPLLEDEYDKMAALISEHIGDKVTIPEFDGIRNASFNRVYNDLIAVTLILTIICAFNYCIIYRYILEKRRKTFAISRVCGCTRFKAVIIYMVELLSISLVTLGAGLATYLKLILPKAVNYFEYIEYYYEYADVVRIAAIYVLSLFVVYFVLIIKFVWTTPANLVRGCK